jgi:glutathionylspermidine synthase
MTWTETFNCDICGKQKGNTDHWWLAWTEKYSPHTDAPAREMFKVYPWENMMAHDADAKHLCGQACLQKLLDRWLNAEMSEEIRQAKKQSA